MQHKKVVYGFHAVQALLKASPDVVKVLYVQKGRSDDRMSESLGLAKAQQISIQTLPRDAMDQMAGHTKHQGVIAEVSRFIEYSENDLETLLDFDSQDLLILVLDGVQDPHNLGACMRSANALGANVVLAPRDKAVGLTDTARKIASGAAEITPFIQVTNLSRTLKALKDKGVWVVGTDADAEQRLDQIDLKGNIAMILGSEGQGMRRLTRDHCDYLASIPLCGTVSSLNVSVATGICLYEARRQRV